MNEPDKKETILSGFSCNRLQGEKGQRKRRISNWAVITLRNIVSG